MKRTIKRNRKIIYFSFFGKRIKEVCRFKYTIHQNIFSYHENVQRLSKAYRDRPVTPMETAIWWTEYIARGNGRFYFRSDSTGLSWYQRHLVDVTLVLIIVSMIFIYILFRLIKLLLTLLRFFKRSQVEEKRKLKKDN